MDEIEKERDLNKVNQKTKGKTKLKRWSFRNLSLQKTLMLLTIAAALLVVILVPFEADLFQKLYDNIENQYMASREIAEGSGFFIQYAETEPTARDQFLMRAIYVVRAVWCLGTIAGAVILEAVVFYRLKLKKPLALLKEASEKIKNNDLDFTIRYDAGDEMGALCGSFEKMRAALSDSNRAMWRSMEERRRLNAAFAHDLRTPITVLKGYADLLKNYIPSDKLPKEKLISTADTMGRHIVRLENYVTGMNCLQKLGDIVPVKVWVESCMFKQELYESAKIVLAKAGARAEIAAKLPAKLFLAHDLVLQVSENLISNASRFAKEKVRIELGCRTGMFVLTVTDDGCGFSGEELNNADKPYYRKKDEQGLHLGLGLNICKILCEKCGGSLKVANAPAGGAQITAEFEAFSEDNG